MPLQEPVRRTWSGSETLLGEFKAHYLGNTDTTAEADVEQCVEATTRVTRKRLRKKCVVTLTGEQLRFAHPKAVTDVYAVIPLEFLTFVMVSDRHEKQVSIISNFEHVDRTDCHVLHVQDPVRFTETLNRAVMGHQSWADTLRDEAAQFTQRKTLHVKDGKNGFTIASMRKHNPLFDLALLKLAEPVAEQRLSQSIHQRKRTGWMARLPDVARTQSTDSLASDFSDFSVSEDYPALS